MPRLVNPQDSTGDKMNPQLKEMIKMPDKDGTGPKGQGPKDGKGKGKGNRTGPGQGPMTGGKEGTKKITKK
jgi:hypothetical protein